jgi:hypothetical protein
MIEPNDPSVIERSLFQPFLEPGEKVIWTGKPARLRWFGSDNWNKIVAGFAVMFMLPSAMAVGFIWRNVTRHGWDAIFEDWAPPALQALFTAGFLSLVVVLVRRRLARLRRTRYALTERRAISLELDEQPFATSSALDLINRFDGDVRADGSGDLVFGYRREYVKDTEGGSGWQEKPRLTFEDITDVPRVLCLAQEALAKLGYQTVS